MDNSRTNILRDNIARFHRGEITEKQYLEQERRMYSEEMNKAKIKMDSATEYYESMATMVANLDEKIQALEEE